MNVSASVNTEENFFELKTKCVERVLFNYVQGQMSDTICGFFKAVKGLKIFERCVCVVFLLAAALIGVYACRRSLHFLSCPCFDFFIKFSHKSRILFVSK